MFKRKKKYTLKDNFIQTETVSGFDRKKRSQWVYTKFMGVYYGTDSTEISSLN